MRRKLIMAAGAILATTVAGGTSWADPGPGDPTSAIDSCNGVYTCIAAVEAPLADAAAKRAVNKSYGDPQVTFDVPVVVGSLDTTGDGPSTTWTPCNITLHATSKYNKPSFSFTIAESGFDYTTTTCPSYAISSFSVSARIQDFGVQPLSSTHSDSDSGSSTAGAEASAYAAQGVSLYSFPVDYHGYGSTMLWSYRLHIAYTKYGRGAADLCIQHQASYGGGISGGPTACF